MPKTIKVLPPSLKNIYKELANDIPNFRIPDHGCLGTDQSLFFPSRPFFLFLEKWAKSGVLLLNAALTVE